MCGVLAVYINFHTRLKPSSVQFYVITIISSFRLGSFVLLFFRRRLFSFIRLQTLSSITLKHYCPTVFSLFFLLVLMLRVKWLCSGFGGKNMRLPLKLRLLFDFSSLLFSYAAVMAIMWFSWAQITPYNIMLVSLSFWNARTVNEYSFFFLHFRSLLY